MSETSQATGAETSDSKAASGSGDAPGDKRKKRGFPSSVTAEFEHARWRHFGWAIFGLVVGVLFVLWLGMLGKVIGVALLVVAVLNGRNFAKTIMHPAGEIAVGAESLRIAAGLCSGETREFTYKDVKHAFFLRRAVPWTRAGPVLIIETGDEAFSYPRDWFSSDADQKRVVAAICRRLGR